MKKSLNIHPNDIIKIVNGIYGGIKKNTKIQRPFLLLSEISKLQANIHDMITLL